MLTVIREDFGCIGTSSFLVCKLFGNFVLNRSFDDQELKNQFEFISIRRRIDWATSNWKTSQEDAVQEVDEELEDEDRTSETGSLLLRKPTLVKDGDTHAQVGSIYWLSVQGFEERLVG